MVYPFIALIVTCLAWSAFTRGTGMALGRGWMLAILGPCWIGAQVGSAEIDLRLVAVVTAIGLLAFVRDWSWPSKFCWSDAAAAALVLVQMASEMENGGFGAKAVFQISVQWGMPYVLGRLLFRSPEETRRLLPIVCTLCVVLSLWVVSESVTKVNIVNRAMNHLGSSQSETEPRWGFRRAEGPTSHPIFCGLLLVGLFPWAMQARQAAVDKQGPSWWRATPWCIAAGVFCTMSRGPQLALLGTVAAMAFFRWPRLRVPMLAGIGALLLTAAVASESLLNALQSWSSESHAGRSYITIGGEQYRYSGTRHRLLQALVFADAMYQAGPFGYGVQSLSSHPLVVPNVEPHLLNSPFDSIDNHYIYFILAAGYLGLTSFVVLGVLSLAKIAVLACDRQDEAWSLAAAMFGAQLAIMLSVATVWFADDFGFQWLVNAGYITSWYGYRRTQQQAATARTPLTVKPSPRRLVPGHPVFAALGADPASGT
jgi:hypothetical protein